MSATCNSTLKIVAFCAIASLARSVAKHANRDVAHRHRLAVPDLAGLAHFCDAVDGHRSRRYQRLASATARANAGDLQEVVERDEFVGQRKLDSTHGQASSLAPDTRDSARIALCLAGPPGGHRRSFRIDSRP